MKYKFEVATDHIILLQKVPDRTMKLLLDTGASFNVLKGEYYGPLSLRKISEKVETELDALVGYPFMRGHTIKIDWKRKEVIFTKDVLCNSRTLNGVGTSVEADKAGGLIKFPVQIMYEGEYEPVQSIFDSGAKISYIHSKYVKNPFFGPKIYHHITTKDDFYPFYGDFKTKIYRKVVIVNGSFVVLHFGVLPKKLENMMMIDKKMIIGTEICKKYRVTCSMTRNIFKLEEYRNGN